MLRVLPTLLLPLIFLIGLPPGVLNIVHGSVDTVNAICDHPDIKAISFVGGDKAGKHIYHRYVSLGPIFRSPADKVTRARLTGKRVQCNMGAKNHAVIMPDGGSSAGIITLVAYTKFKRMLTTR
jgi:malonate-semialdehyde dehydrogenase (acetylating)/methylmalonate-semialdehyde dehydrogenase